jgi:cell division protein FtsB
LLRARDGWLPSLWSRHTLGSPAGPQGLPALLEKHREIRHLEKQNAALARENEMRQERIKRLETSFSEQEMEIRKQLKLLRPGETTFILPDQPKDEQPQQPQPKP